MARETMNLCASNPQALADDGAKNIAVRTAVAIDAYRIIAECLVSALTCRLPAVCRSRSPAPTVHRCETLQIFTQEREPVARPAAAAGRDRGVQAGRRERERDHADRRARQLPHQSRDDQPGAARAVDRRARRGGRSRRSAGTARRRSASGRPDDGAGRSGDLTHRRVRSRRC